MNEFYTYAYLDPRKNGKFTYKDVSFMFEPFYIGKGHGNRYKYFLDHNKKCQNKVKKILLETKLEPIVVLVKENLAEEEAFVLERQLIKEIGRSNLKLGPLTNLTDGGEGLSGLTHSEETKKKMSQNHADLSGSRNPFFGRKHSKETKLKMAESLKGKRKTEDHCKNLSKALKGKYHSSEAKKKMSNAKAGENNPFHKLSEQDVREIKTLLRDKKLKQKEICDIFRVDRSTISNIKNGRQWSHILIT